MQHILFELGAVQLSLKAPDRALRTLRKAYELAPEWTVARNRYAAAAIAAGQMELAERLLLPTEGTIAVGDEWIINSLRATGDLPNLVEALKKRIRVMRRAGEDTSGLENELKEARRALARSEAGKRP
jgi:hypothetical protein